MKKSTAGTLLVLPAAALIVLIMILPLFYTVFCSVSNMDYMQFGGLVGLRNFQKIFADPNTFYSLFITVIITFATVVLSMLGGTLLAVWADKKSRAFAYVIEIIGLIPWVTSMVVSGLLWKWILDGDMGLLNYLLSRIGIGKLSMLSSKTPAILATILVMSWRTIGYSMVMVLGGLKGLPGGLLEAGAVDGASERQIFWKIKVPLLKTPLLISFVVLTMSNFNNMTIPLVLTSGGPGNATNVISLMMYKMGFNYYQFGPACALAIVVFALNILLVAVYIKAMRYKL